MVAMRFVTAAALLVLVSACSGGSERSDSPELTAAQAVQQACEEVRAGIDDFNRQDYVATVEHFEAAKAPAAVYADVDRAPEADDLLEAVEYYADLAPDDYPEAARSSKRFARNKAITLEQCVAGEPIDETPATPV